ncbi:MAG: hypothetical protein U0793_14525 [Gemmataceae bacterium]
MACLSLLGCQTAFDRSGAITAKATPNEEAAKEAEPARVAPPAAEEKTPDAKDERNLTLAAIYLDQGQDARACAQLEIYLGKHPEHAGARYYHAELLFRQKRNAEAKTEFAAAVAALQDERFLDVRKLIHCHGRLADIAALEDDDFALQLQRGIALFWLSQMPAACADEEEQAPVEGLLCKAVGALTQAHELEPEDARACWYLHTAWRKLGQDPPARRFLTLAQAHAPFSYLTPAEHRDLCLAAH